MKSKIYSIDGKEKGSVDLPKCFSAKIREDLIAKVLEAKKSKQPYAPSPVGGKQHSASGIIIHRRHVWKSGYGRGRSRIPRKIMSQRGSQFNWVGATVPSAVGGRRAHPPKIAGMINVLKINKKEEKIAFCSALAATVDGKKVSEKYSRLDKVEVPFVVEDKIVKLKAKELKDSLKKILGDAFVVAIPEKSVRAGKGKARGRKYKKNAGVLLVIGSKEKMKTSLIDVKQVNSLGVADLAKGGSGRLVVYTEKAIREIENKFKEKEK